MIASQSHGSVAETDSFPHQNVEALETDGSSLSHTLTNGKYVRG